MIRPLILIQRCRALLSLVWAAAAAIPSIACSACVCQASAWWLPILTQLALNACSADERILLGKDLTRGLGSGGDPEVGIQAAEESFRELIGAIKGTGILFLTAGMGGGTGSGAIQIAARIAKSLGVLTIAIVTTPFSFESGLAHPDSA